MSFHIRKTAYRCRVPQCKHMNVVMQKIDHAQRVIETAPAWQGRCAQCGSASLDFIYFKDLVPEPK